jgi:hypothetical protein
MKIYLILFIFLLFNLIFAENIKKEKEYPIEHYLQLGDQSLRENKYSQATGKFFLK